MKKWLIVAVALVTLTALVYLLIPNRILIQKSITVNAREDALFRNLRNSKNWKKWWPLNNAPLQQSANTLEYLTTNENAYSLKDILINSLLIDASSNNTLIKTSIDFLSVSIDSTVLSWNAVVVTSYNPYKRITAYFKSRAIKQDMSVILAKIKSYFSTIENIYGIDIKQVPIEDSTLIFTIDSTKGYPDMAFVYSLIGQLKNFTTQQSAKVTGYPMLNVYKKDSITYITKVAIPINKILKDSGRFKYRWMLGGGRILMADVAGGRYKLETAIQQIQSYMKDRGLAAPAIPFMSLTTDRLQQPDSTKWVTRVFCPIM